MESRQISSSSDGAGLSKRKRSRPILACKRCKGLKLKCDHATPCGSCSRADASDHCVYEQVLPSTVDEAVKSKLSLARRSRAVLVCTRCKKLKLKCDHGRPCNACLRARLDDQCVYVPWPETTAPSTQASHFSPNFFRGQMALRGTEPAVIGPPSSSSTDLRLAHLISLFPPVLQCQDLLGKFFSFDVMFRFTHRSSFSRRAEDVFKRIPALCKTDVPFLTALSAALLIGIDSSTMDLQANLRSLFDGLVLFCESNSLFGVDYVHALLLDVLSHMSGPSSSPATTWISVGKAYHAALLVGIQKDSMTENFFEREIRRRIWWHIHISKRLLAGKLKIHVESDSVVVPRPLVVSDDYLELPTADGLSEWAYVDLKISFCDCAANTKDIMGQEVPLFNKLSDCHRLFDEFKSNLTPHLKLTTPVYGDPPWIYAQACVVSISINEAIVELYKPYLGTVVGSFAFSNAIAAAHKLISDVQAYTTFLLFRWIDGCSASLWTFGTKAFLGGMVMAFAILSEPDNPSSLEQIAALDAAVGVLRSTASATGSPMSNISALVILEKLRAAIGDRSKLEHSVIDPYTGQTIALPKPIELDLSGDWVEWEAIFKDLIHTI